MVLIVSYVRVGHVCGRHYHPRRAGRSFSFGVYVKQRRASKERASATSAGASPSLIILPNAPASPASPSVHAVSPRLYSPLLAIVTARLVLSHKVNTQG